MLYLGCKIKSDGKRAREIKQRIALEKTAFSEKTQITHVKKVTSRYQEYTY